VNKSEHVVRCGVIRALSVRCDGCSKLLLQAICEHVMLFSTLFGDEGLQRPPHQDIVTTVSCSRDGEDEIRPRHVEFRSIATNDC
jgi:hypothetical protein